MPRKPRIEFAGAIYHVLNTGAYRGALFGSSAAAEALVDALFQTCGRMGWRLHAFCLLRNQYHLAVETPRGNLGEGVHWLQRAFGNRHNRFRGEPGPAFTQRYRAIVVEPGSALSELVDSIHLAPVHAEIVPFDLLHKFRWSSFRYLLGAEAKRPGFFASRAGSSPATEIERLAQWLAKDPAARGATLERMSRGPVIGSAEFRARILADFSPPGPGQHWVRHQLREKHLHEWAARFETALTACERREGDHAYDSKSAPWKIAIATWLKASTGVSNRWLTERLSMGPPDAVSRYVGECQRGGRPEAREWLMRLEGLE